MASDWLATVLPANQMPGLKICVKQHVFQHRIFLVTQAPDNHNNAIGYYRFLTHSSGNRLA